MTGNKDKRRLDFRRFLESGPGSFPEQRLVIEPRINGVFCFCIYTVYF